MAARQILTERWKGPTYSRVNPVTPTVATTATRVFRNHPDRVMLLAINLSSYDGYIGFDTEVSSTKGILVPASGGFFELLLEEDGELVTQEVYAISPGGSATWYFVEVLRK